MPLKQKHKNYLFLIRKKLGLEQKQVAALLGHKTADQISRYERGAKLPNLKTAFILSAIFRLPVHILFYDYYKACLKELEKREKDLKTGEDSLDLSETDENESTEFCSFEEKLKPFVVKETDLNKVRHHIAELVTARSKRMKHWSKR